MRSTDELCEELIRIDNNSRKHVLNTDYSLIPHHLMELLREKFGNRGFGVYDVS